MLASVRISLPNQSHFVIDRGDGVSEVYWGKLGAEWGYASPNPSEQIITPVEVFLSNLAWFPDACREYNVNPDFEEQALSRIKNSLGERKSVSAILKGVSPLSPEEASARLEGGRFSRTLKPFQIRDLCRLLTLPHGANFSVPGAGKTTVTYALYEAERLAGKVSRMLVISPISAFDSWQNEALDCFSVPPVIERFSGQPIEPDVEICLVNYDRLPSSYEEIAEWVREANTHIILDEAHRIKRGWRGSWGANSLRLSRLGTRRDILTGTPAPQGAGDVTALIDFVWPNQARTILPASAFMAKPPQSVGAEIRPRLTPLFVRTTKSDLALPEPIFRMENIPLQGLQRDIYEALRNRYAGALLPNRSDRMLFQRLGRVVMYLLEAATNPALLPFGGKPDPVSLQPVFPQQDIPLDANLIELLESYPTYELPVKISKLAELVNANAQQGRKTLVWTNFIANIQMLETTFAALNPAAIYGGVPSELTSPNSDRTREDELKRFREDSSCLVLLANPAAMSEGVSLHKECHDAIYLDRTFNAGHYLQSVDRIHRLGMPEVDTNITFLVVQETIDVAVFQRVRDKANFLGDILNDSDIGKMSLPDEESSLEYIETEDVEALFQHLSGGAIYPEGGNGT